MADVNALINNATSQANSFSENAESILNSAASKASGRVDLFWQNLVYNPTLVDPEYDEDELPSFNDYYNAPINDSSRPVFRDLFIPATPLYPDRVTIDTTGLFEQSTPVYDIAPFAKTAPDVDIDSLKTEITNIASPNIQEIEAPTVTEYNVSEKPDVIFPVYTPSAVNPNIDDPTELASRYEAEYEEALPAMKSFIENNIQTWINTYAPEYSTALATLEAKLATDIESGKAMSDEFETALYNRAKSRVEKERERVTEEVTNGMSKRGFELPQGAFTAGLQNAHQAAADNIAIQSTELAIERAKLEIQHVQFVMQMSVSVRQMLLSSSLQYAQILVSINGQALEHSKQIVLFVAEFYEQLLKKAGLTIDVLRIESTIYETQLKSALAQLDNIRLELDIAKQQKDVELIDVQIFTKRIDAENTKIQQYLALLEGVDKKAQLERIAVELFGEEVKAYTALVGSKNAEFGAYTAALSGDEAKLKGEVAKVDVYTQQVQAEGQKLNVDIARLESINTYNRNLTQQYSSELEGYKAEIAAEGARFDGVVNKHNAELRAYIEDNNVKLKTFETQYKKAQLDLNAADAQFKGNMNISIENARNFMRSVDVQADTAVATGGVFARMAGAALSSQNTMVSEVNSN